MSRRRLFQIAAVLFVASLQLIASQSVTAQSVAKGSWKFANDSPDAIKTKPPTKQVAAGKKAFAKGEAEAVLGKGGPSGVFLWAHWHGVHNDRAGKTKYKVTALVRDEGNYYYMALPVLDQEVKGVADKPDRHRHGFGQFRLPPGDDAEALKDAVDAKVKLIVEVNGLRDNKGFFGTVQDDAKKIVGKYLEGKVDAKELLKGLNKGKSPKK